MLVTNSWTLAMCQVSSHLMLLILIVWECQNTSSGVQAMLTLWHVAKTISVILNFTSFSWGSIWIPGARTFGLVVNAGLCWDVQHSVQSSYRSAVTCLLDAIRKAHLGLVLGSHTWAGIKVAWRVCFITDAELRQWFLIQPVELRFWKLGF